MLPSLLLLLLLLLTRLLSLTAVGVVGIPGWQTHPPRGAAALTGVEPDAQASGMWETLVWETLVRGAGDGAEWEGIERGGVE